MKRLAISMALAVMIGMGSAAYAAPCGRVDCAVADPIISTPAQGGGCSGYDCAIPQTAPFQTAEPCIGSNCVLPGPNPVVIIIAGALLAIAIMRPARA